MNTSLPPAQAARAYFDTVAVARPAPQVHANLPRSFDAERDLHQFYLAAKQSNDVAVVYQAYRAYVQCQALVSNADNVRVAFSGGDHARIEGDMTAERAMAADEVFRRCHGFERMSARDLVDAGAQLRERLKSLGSVEAALDGGDEPRDITPATMAALTRMRTSSAFDRAEPALSKYFSQTMNAEPGSAQARDIELAVMLAGCDLGKDCTANAFAALLNCAYYDSCGKPMGYDWREGLSEADIARILALKNRLVERITAGDFTGSTR